MITGNRAKDVVAYAIDEWKKTFAGTSGLAIAAAMSMPHDEVLLILESLADEGKGTLNRNVELYEFTLNFTSQSNLEKRSTHIFLPSKEVLREAFYQSDLPKQNLPEYERRLHLGANQIGLVFCSEEVLSRYFSHPEWYYVDDSLSGGQVSTKSGAPDDRHVHVRYGKSRQVNGQVAVVAIYKDLGAMSAVEQHYWHSYELASPQPLVGDENFARFLLRDFVGEAVHYPNPINDIIEGLREVNSTVGDKQLFRRLQNVHLRLPVENTYKDLCDCASELYKLVGPDGIDQKVLRRFLLRRLKVPKDQLRHAETDRAFSPMELLELLEEKMACGNALTKAIKAIKDLRIDADHKVLPEESSCGTHGSQFTELCNKLSEGLRSFAAILIQQHGDT